MKKKIIILLIFILITIIVGVGIFKNNNEVNRIKDKKLTVAMSGTYYPFTFSSGNEVEGFDVDVWNEIGKRLGYDIEFKTASFSGLFGMLDSGKASTISNQITVTPEREEKYYFSDPYVYSGAQIIVKKGNSEGINSFEDLKGKTVGVDLGSNYEKIVKDKDINNEIEVITYQSTDAAFNDLMLGRIQGVVVDRISALVTINEKGLELELVGEPIEEIYNAFPFQKTEENKALVEKINQVLSDMKNDGTFEKISKQWLNTDITSNGSESYLKKLMLSVMEGLKTTIYLTIISMVIGLVVGISIAVIRVFKIPILKQLVGIHVSFFRGTPLLVQLFLLYFGLPQIIPALQNMSAFTAAYIGLGLNASAYIAETLRGAIEAIDRGQMEACLSMGMTKSQGMRRVVLPQAFRIAIPSLGNIFVDNVKGSSLAFTLGVTEILSRAQMSAAASYRFFESYIVIAIVYWILIGIVNYFQRLLERKISAY
ncbi:MAG: ABC transporter permease subunit [Clostridium sp.]|uniref:ABC transporter permease subunit n=1 Tax=Clostridium sp. TaxID=1506 RepID=UPI003217FE31